MPIMAQEICVNLQVWEQKVELNNLVSGKIQSVTESCNEQGWVMLSYKSLVLE